MSSGKSRSQPVQQYQAPQPQYGTNTNEASGTATQQFTPWAPTAGTYGRMADQVNYMSAQGPQVIGPSAATQQGWGLAQQAIPGMGEVANTGQQNYNFLSRAADVANNPYVQGMMQTNNQQAMQALQRQMLPALQSGAVGVNNLGSSRLGLAQGQAIGDTQTAMQNANNSLMMGAYQQGLGAQQSALNSMGALQSAQAMPALAAGQIGQQQEQYQREAADAPWRHLQNQGAALQYLNPLGTLTGTNQTRGTASSGPLGYNGTAAPAPAAPVDPSNPYGLQGLNPALQAQIPPGMQGSAGMWWNPS